MFPPPWASAPRLALPWDRDPTGQVWLPPRPRSPRPRHTNQSFAGKGWERHLLSPGGGALTASPCPVPPPRFPPCRRAGAPVPRDGRGLRWEWTPREPSPGYPGPGVMGEDPAWELSVEPGRGGASLPARGQTDRGQTPSFVPSPSAASPAQVALSQPAAPGASLGRDPAGRGPGHTSEGTRWKGDRAAPQAPGRAQRRDGGAGRRERRAGDTGSQTVLELGGSGAGAGLGLPAPRQSLTTGTCWEWDGAAAPLLAGAARGPGASLCPLPPPLLPPPLLFPFSLPSLSEVEPRGMAKQVS